MADENHRILHVIWALEIGGAERAVYQLVREQRRRGLTADIAVGSRAGLYGERTREAGAQVFELAQRRALDVRTLHHASSLFKRYDIVHLHSAEPVLAAVAARVADRAYYTHRSGQFAYPWKQRIRYKISGLLIRRAFAGVSANTRYAALVASELFGLVPDSIATTYNGLAFDLLKPERSREQIQRALREAGDMSIDREDVLRVATSGNLRTWKRIDRLIEAVAAANNAVVGYVIGDGPDRARLESIARERRISHRIVFTGMQENVVDFLQLMDAFVLPSGPAEAFGNSAVEAMALGLPTVVFADGGGLVEHIQDGDTGFIVSDTAALTELLDRMAVDAQLRARIGTAGAATVRSRYTVSRMFEAYERLYNGDAGENVVTGLLARQEPTLRVVCITPSDLQVPRIN